MLFPRRPSISAVVERESRLSRRSPISASAWTDSGREKRTVKAIRPEPNVPAEIRAIDQEEAMTILRAFNAMPRPVPGASNPPAGYQPYKRQISSSRS